MNTTTQSPLSSNIGTLGGNASTSYVSFPPSSNFSYNWNPQPNYLEILDSNLRAIGQLHTLLESDHLDVATKKVIKAKINKYLELI